MTAPIRYRGRSSLRTRRPMPCLHHKDAPQSHRPADGCVIRFPVTETDGESPACRELSASFFCPLVFLVSTIPSPLPASFLDPVHFLLLFCFFFAKPLFCPVGGCFIPFAVRMSSKASHCSFIYIFRPHLNNILHFTSFVPIPRLLTTVPACGCFL